MTDDLEDLLNAVPEPTVPPVDLPRLYAEAGAMQARRAVRWKRAALGFALAASVFGVLASPLRWGDAPPAPINRDDDAVRELARENSARLAALEANQAELKDLLLLVAADAHTAQSGQLAAHDRHAKLAMWVVAQFAESDAKFADLRKDSSAMYSLVTAPRGR